MMKNMKALPRVLFTNPLVHLSPTPFEQQYNIKVLQPGTTTHHNEPLQTTFINTVNEFKPNVIYFSFAAKLLVNQKDFYQYLTPESLQELKLIANLGVGYDKINPHNSKSNNIYVSNTPDVVSDATADLTLALILNCARKTSFFEASLRRGEWNAGGTTFGFDLRDKVLGIVGCGAIGKEVVKRAQPFGMKIKYFKRQRLSDQEEKQLNLDSNAFESDLHSLLSQSDIVSIHTPLNESTRHLISTEEFKHMKPSSYLINTSRGPVVDEEALVQALKSGVIKGCGLDVYEHEPQIHPGLLHLDNVVLYPHIGTQTRDTRTNMETLCMKNIESVLIHGARPVTPVPELKDFERRN